MLKTKKSLEERFKTHPELRNQVERLLDIAESGIRKADDVEVEIVESIRQLGQQAIGDWAQNSASLASEQWREDKEEFKDHGKKNSTGIAR